MGATATARPTLRKARSATGKAASRPPAGGAVAGGSGVTASVSRLSPRGRAFLGVVAAVLVAVFGFMIGLNAGRPDWPADGSADVGFARDMSSHHAQAVELGMIAYQRATNEAVRSLGYDIALAQQGQIGIMQTWLDTWRVPRTTSDPPMSWVPGGDEMVRGNLMPGMATREEVNQLMTATGEQVDILFLQLMLRHHVGGIHMVEEVLAADPSPPVRELAEAMQRGQESEVVLMNDLLKQFGASPLPN